MSRAYHRNTSNGRNAMTSSNTYGTQHYMNGLGLVPSSSCYLGDGWEHDGDTRGGDGDGGDDDGFQMYVNMETQHSEGQDAIMQVNGKLFM